MPGRLTADDLLELWRRVLDGSYTDPMELAGDGSGIEVYKAHAAMLARAAESIDVTTQATFILPHAAQTNPPAAGAQRATVEVTVTRTLQLHLVIQLTAGQVLVTDEVGRQFVVDEDSVLDAGVTSLAVPVRAARPGYSYNIADDQLTEFVQPGADFTNAGATVQVVGADNFLVDTGFPDVLSPGHVGQYLQFAAGANLGAIRRISAWQRNFDGTNTVTLVDDSVVPLALVAEVGTAEWRILDWDTDLTLAVTNPLAATGGISGLLDALGAERRVSRTPGETDDGYRSRIATLPDVVSPNAIRRIGNRILAPLGESVVLREIGTACLPGWYFDFDAWDYDFVIRPDDRFKLFMSLLEFRGFFLLGVPNRIDGEFGLFYDDAGPVDGNGAFDADIGAGFWDGWPATYWGSYVAAIWSQVNLAKAGGVGFEIYLIQADDPPC
jgi:hypothetical protein